MDGKSPTRKTAFQLWFQFHERHEARLQVAGAALEYKSRGVVAANDETGGRNRRISGQVEPVRGTACARMRSLGKSPGLPGLTQSEAAGATTTAYAR